MDNLVLDTTFSAEGAEPVTLADAKAWLKVDIADDDLLITELITTARRDCETYLCTSLIPRTITAYLQIGLGEIRLPYGPVDVITTVTDLDGNVIDYITKYETFKALDPVTEVKAVYTTLGQGAKFKTAVMKQLAFLYEHRGDETELNAEVMRQLKPHRRVV
jgi:uncharacterized phiE125 gp8 family phage protein